jgi:hypothetical protein
MIAFTVTTAAALQPTSYLYAYLNTDMNPATGSLSGADYLLAYEQHSDGWGWAIMKWSGSDWVMTGQTPTMYMNRSGNTLTWNFAASDVGVSSGFTFYVVAGAVDASDSVVARDYAPDNGMWAYMLTTSSSPPPTTTPTSTSSPAKTLALKIWPPKTVPSYAVAGKRFTVSFSVDVEKQEAATVIDIATGQVKGDATMVSWDPLPSGKMVCDPSIGGKVIPHAESLKAGTAKLSFIVPKTAKGKQLRVKVAITAQGKSATRVATFRVR